MKRVRVSELKSHLSEHLRAAEAGETIEVLDRARSIARLVPIPSDEDEAEIIPPKQPFRAVRTVRLPPLGSAVDSGRLLREERGDR